jgi:hypothetical protein
MTDRRNQEAVMASSIALAVSEVPSAVLHQPEIARRIVERGGLAEVRFWVRDPKPILPVLFQGQFLLPRWGSDYRHGSPCPTTGWIWRKELDRIAAAGLEIHPVMIPANAACENGIWYRVREGIEGALVYDALGQAMTYMLVDTASHYYQTMTRSTREPILRGEVI